MGLKKLKLTFFITTITTMCTRLVILYVNCEVTGFECNYQSIPKSTLKLRYSVLHVVYNLSISEHLLHSDITFDFFTAKTKSFENNGSCAKVVILKNTLANLEFFVNKFKEQKSLHQY